MKNECSSEYGAFKTFMCRASFCQDVVFAYCRGLFRWRRKTTVDGSKVCLHLAVKDQHSAESQVLDARVALQLHRFGLNPCRILSRRCSDFTAFSWYPWLFKNSFTVSPAVSHNTFTVMLMHLPVLCHCSGSF